MKIETVTPPSEEPVTYEQVKAHLRLDDDAEQAWLTDQIVAAREYAETATNSSLVTRQLKVTFTDSDLPMPFVALPRGPVQSIDAVEDRNGNAVNPDAYDLRRIGTTDVLNPIRTSGPLVVTYTAGYGAAADVPQKVKTAILMHVAHLWRNREAVSDKPQNHVALGLQAIYYQVQLGGLL